MKRSIVRAIVMTMVVVVMLLLVECNQLKGSEQNSMRTEQSKRSGPLAEDGGTIQISVPKVDGGEQMEINYTKERINLKTKDGVQLVGSYYDAKGKEGIVLLHQLNSDRSSWDQFARSAQRKGYPVVTIDFRGHGESEGRWQEFTNNDFRKMLFDAETAAEYLQQKGISVLAILGASIGANTALRYSAENKIPTVLLSPGLDYHGIDINNVTSTASTLIIVSQDDNYARSSSEEIDKNNLFGQHQLMIIPGKNHGVFMLENESVEERIFNFLKRIDNKSIDKNTPAGN